MEFSEIVYRGYGHHQRKGGGFSTLGAHSKEALTKALADGWFRTLPEAIKAHDDAKLSQSAPVAKKASEVPPDTAPPTRAEIEAKCAELGIKVHHKNSDSTLLERIEEALKAKA